MKTLAICAHALLWIACFTWTDGGEPASAADLAQQRGAGAPVAPAQEPRDYSELRAQAEARFTEGSYALAHELYERANAFELTPEESRWVDFRLADTQWRAASQTNDADTGLVDGALRDLTEQLERYERPEQRDELFAELHESLGDASWRERVQDWGTAWTHYSTALEWWGRSSDLERARGRWLGIVWKAALPPWRERYWGTGYFPVYMQPEVLEDALTLARTPDEKGAAHYLSGRAWMNQMYERSAAERVQRELGAVLALGRESEWYDDALFALAQFHESSGRWERGPNQSWIAKPDYAKAVELYRRLLTEFPKGESRYVDQARQRVQDITAPSLTVQVERFFLPGSEVQFRLAWRNCARVELALHPVDLARDVTFASVESDDWLATLPLGPAEPFARWAHEAQEKSKHEPGDAALLVPQKPPAGAYVLLASSAGIQSRALVLVSDVAVTVKASGSKLLAWATDVQGGAPLAEADVRVWERWHDGRAWRRTDRSEQTGVDGTALFELEAREGGGQYFVALKSGARQAFAQGWLPGRTPPAQEWRIYATTDRAAYRPGNLVQWTSWARARTDGEYRTPSGETLTWEVVDPRGSVVHEGQGKLNAFGAAWSSLETTATWTLGEYRIRFWRGAGKNESIGEAALFRLEEYKLPEFEVTVKTPEDPPGSGKPRLYLLGDRVEVEIESTYYYGAPVSDATVEVFVHQRPRYRPIPVDHEFPWFYDDAREIQWWGGPGQQILHETTATDAAGKVTIAFDTSAAAFGGAPGEFEYTIEARVTDASRREIVGTGAVVVAAQSYRVDVNVPHAIHVPGGKVAVDFVARDPNDNPVVDDGHVTVTRERWIEIWLDPTGREVLGDALEKLQGDARGFPPPGEPGWQPKFRGYESEPIAQADVRTGPDGTARFEFTPPKEGYYRIAWTSTDDRENDIRGEASLFVADEKTQRLGYQAGGIEILLDRDTLEVGKEASILLLAPTNGRWVLFTVEGEELYQHQVLQLTGQVKLVHLSITAAHVPNVYLGAVSMWGGRAWQDMEELVVPPVEQFLTVEVTTDRPDYQPGEEGALSVSVKNRAGEPVPAALTLNVVDEAVAYIQGDYAIDPRQFFYGEKRPHLVQTAGSFQHGSYTELVKDAKGDVQERGRELYGMKEGRRDAFDEERLGAVAQDAVEGDFFAGREALSESVSSKSMLRMERANAPPAAAAPGGAAEPAVRVRSDFRETALWTPFVETDATGKARVPVKFPDSTTRWRASARAFDAATRVGMGNATVRTRLPLTARLQAPRFFVVGDAVTISGNIDNATDRPLSVKPTLEVQGLALASDRAPGTVEIPAHGQVRVDWTVKALEEGTATLKLSAVGDEHSDAQERTLPVLAHGMEAFVNLAGKLDQGALELTLDLPRERRPESTAVEVTIAPSLAVTMLDALPYLADFPYGCTEQTLSRFLPAVIVAKTLRELGLSAEDALARTFGGIEPDSAAATHPGGKRGAEKLDEMVKAGLERLYDFQHGDGSWAWWKDGDGDPFMTAYVLWGLSLARQADVDVRSEVLENAARWVALEIVEAETELDLAAWMLHALTAYGDAGLDATALGARDAAFQRLWEARDGLNAYARSLLLLSAVALERREEARILADNLRNGAIVDETPDTSIVQVGAQAHQPFAMTTAHFGQDGIWRRWSEGSVEATAFALRALVAVDPKHELVSPLMTWLVKNRRGAQWSNTRDTAITVLALSGYLRASGELASAVEYELTVNGQSIATRRIEREGLLTAPSTFTVARELLRDGANTVRIARKAGEAPLYFSARARFFSLEEPVPSRGSEVFVRRDYYRLAGRPTLLAGTVYDRVPLEDGGSLTSGERVEVVLTLDAKNDLEYLVVEDRKPAGLESVQVRSGEPMQARELTREETRARFGTAADDTEQEQRRRGATRGTTIEPTSTGTTGRSRSAHQELRDRQVAFFLDKLPQGVWELRYELRGEVPGTFHALPAQAHAMYVPEIRGNGEELRVTVQDR